MTQLINPKEFGIEESKASELQGNLPQLLAERDQLKSQYDALMLADIELPETAKQAKELRKLVKDNRTKGIEVWHRNAKEFFLRGGQFIDAKKKKECDINLLWEENLEKIEKHQELQEKARIADLQAQREALLTPYEVANLSTLQLGTMPQETFDLFLQGAKSAYEKRIEDARIAEERERIRLENERLKKEAEAEERERIRLENERLKKEAEESEKQAQAERSKMEAERKAAEEKARKERESIEAKLKKEREEREKAERELKAKQEAELKAKKEAEAKAEAERKAKELAEKKAKAAPDKEKLLQLATVIDGLQLPDLKTEEAAIILSNTKELLVKVSNYIREQSTKI
jgi:hypothetical protein